jgi:hypothetical protein
MQVHVVVERRAEAVQEGDGSESRVGGGAGGNRYACRSAQQSLDLGKKDLREGPDGRRPVGEKTSQPLRHGDHPLPHGHRRDDVIGEMGCVLTIILLCNVAVSVRLPHRMPPIT